jgi:tetratricopeptide (TPR) repeat protein
MGEVADGYRSRIAALSSSLDAPTALANRDAIRADLISLGKALEQDLGALAALKEEAKALVERWKALQALAAPAFSADRPVVVDHIGATTFIDKGWSRISLGDYVGAEESLTRALQLVPNDPQAEALLGWAQMLQEKYDEALMQFQKVLMRDPANALARINVGYICLKKGIFGEAIEHLSRAIRLDSDRKATLYAHFYLGLVYLERDMFEDAQTFFQKSIALGPNLIEAYFELGRAYWFNGQRDEAVQTWRNGLATNRFNPWGKKCAEVLRTVEEGGEP